MSPGLFQKLSVFVALWGIAYFLWKQPWGVPILVLAVAFGACYGIVAWMLRNDDLRLAKLYGWPGFRQFIDLVCRWRKCQPPVDPSRRKAKSADPGSEDLSKSYLEELLISQPTHFVDLEAHLRRHVVGHDAAVAYLVRQLERNITLRGHSLDHAKLPPLGAFLLVGAPGIGKRHLATIVGRAIYKARHVLTLDLRDFGDDGAAAELFGAEGRNQPGKLLEEVKARPFLILVLENPEQASPLVLERLRAILTEGSCKEPDHDRRVSFKHCVFFFLSTAQYEPLEAYLDAEPSEATRSQVTNLLIQDRGLPSGFLGVIADFLVLGRLSPTNRATVVGLLMEKECRKFDLDLDYVEAEVLAAEVAAMSESEGLQLAPSRVSRLLREPLAKATQLSRKGVLVKRAASDRSKTSVPL